MKKTFLMLFFVFLITTIHAQTREVDSLKQLLQKEKTDTGRVILIRDIILLANYRNNPDSSMQLALKGLEISQRTGFKKGEAISLNSMAIIYLRMGNSARALQLFLQALAINEKIRSNEAGRNLNNIAVIYRQLGNHRQALNYFIKAQSPFEPLSLDDYIKRRAGNPELQKGDPVVILNIGRSYFDLKILDSAWFFAQLAYDQALKNNSQRFIGRSLALMGAINAERNFLTPALEYYS